MDDCGGEGERNTCSILYIKSRFFFIPACRYSDVELTKTCVSFGLLDSVCMCMYHGPGAFVFAALLSFPHLNP